MACMESHWLDPLFKNPADTPVSLEKAVMIFDQLADSEEIFFFLADGCSARAHIMGRQVSELGLVPKKAWAFEGNRWDEDLRVSFAQQDICWWFHVALALPVEMPDGTVTDMVFDPAIFDGPVTLETWGETINAHPDRREIIPFTALPTKYGDTLDKRSVAEKFTISHENDAKAAKTMEIWRDMIPPTESRRPVLATEARRNISPTCAGGKTWVTIPDSAKDPPQPAPPKDGTAPRP